jgi:hypothetical protein
MIDRRVEIATVCNGAMPADTDFFLARPDQLGPDAGLPASTTFVWDPVSDQIAAVFEAEKAGPAGAIEPVNRPIRQLLHGGMGLDDPIEVAVAEGNGVARYYPIYDEAGDGSLQAILSETGKIVSRTIVTDPYGDDEVTLPGAAVAKVIVRNTTGSPAGVDVDVTFTEPIDATTLAEGVHLSSLTVTDTTAATATATPALTTDKRTIRWSLSAAEWTALTGAPNAHALSIAVTGALRSTNYYGGVAIMSANTTLRSGVTATTETPFELHEALSELNPKLASNGSSNLYELTSLVGTNGTTGGNDRARSECCRRPLASCWRCGSPRYGAAGRRAVGRIYPQSARSCERAAHDARQDNRAWSR